MVILDILGRRRTWANGRILAQTSCLKHRCYSGLPLEAPSHAHHIRQAIAAKEERAPPWWVRAGVQLAIALHRILRPPPSYLPGWCETEASSARAGVVTASRDAFSQRSALATSHKIAVPSKAQARDL